MHRVLSSAATRSALACRSAGARVSKFGVAPARSLITTVATAPPARLPVVAAAAAAVAAAATAATAAAVFTVAHCDGGSAMNCKLLASEATANLTAQDKQMSQKEMDAMFDRLDQNHDGVISFEEWRAFLTKSGMSKEKVEALEALFHKLDKDHSGTISREEFQDHFHSEYLARYARLAVLAFLKKGRFIAYTSDIGESARPVMPSWFVNACYGLTFVYVAVAVGHHTQEASAHGASQNMVLRAFTHSATFELIASVAMPSLIIHQAVHFVQHRAHRLPGPVARWAPTVVGLSCIPFLPFLDPPAEVAIDAAFDYAWPDDGTLPPKAHH